ncbi:cytochrome c oxidase subunit IVB [Bacillus sp. Marseille-P3661]|uniref:cytochrome c oxidase subunit IVB n=1 Tax=Bacillus sp. Marseille-P3661 TaxID=1936234 RepID=UPI000C859A28|nr:cytochrome c oxidase subunit IVB [Bacillus sp. Marseille-P3661]
MGINSNSSVQTENLKYRKAKNKEEMKQQLIVFSLTIFLTVIAFAAVAFADTISAWFIGPFILLLAVVQCMFQLFYFMHMSHKGHEAPIVFIFSGVLFVIIIIAGLMLLTWW